jgi:hypothetical protein
MANVLIGIIGVILFIGLALAGALFLGDQFKKATARTNASIVIGQIAQMSQAVEMYRLKTGIASPTCQTVDFLVPRFLKSVPVSPTVTARANVGTYRYTPALNNDLVTDATPTQAAGIPATYITTNLGADSTAREACQVIADMQSGGVQTVSATPSEKSGCGAFSGDYVAWQRL